MLSKEVIGDRTEMQSTCDMRSLEQGKELRAGTGLWADTQ
jgi:hypothetical protein